MMFYSKVLLLSLAFYLLLEEASAFLLPERMRQKRDSGWQDSEVPLHPSELSDQLGTFPGDNTDDVRGTRHSSFPTPLERLSVHHGNTLPRRKPKDKRKKVTTPLDTIGGSFPSNLRSKKEEPEDHWEYFTE